MKYTIYQWNGKNWVTLYNDVEFDDLPESIQRANYLLCAADKHPSLPDSIYSEIVGYCSRREYVEGGNVLIFFENEVGL